MPMYRRRRGTRTFSRDPVKRAATSWQRVLITEPAFTYPNTATLFYSDLLQVSGSTNPHMWQVDESCTIMGGSLTVSVLATSSVPATRVYQLQVQAHVLPAEVARAFQENDIQVPDVVSLLAGGIHQSWQRRSRMAPFAVAAEPHYSEGYHGTLHARFRSKRKLVDGDGIVVSMAAVRAVRTGSSVAATTFVVAGRLDWVCRS